MVGQAPVRLSVLRDIGWDLWDPIQLGGSQGGWRRSNAADEYDRYLMHIAVCLERGKSDDALADYLVVIETEHMGLTDMQTARTRAKATVAAIRAHLENIN